jgi:hypothetical protein
MKHREDAGVGLPCAGVAEEKAARLLSAITPRTGDFEAVEIGSGRKRDAVALPAGLVNITPAVVVGRIGGIGFR